MDELEFYDGAWTGQEIDAGIGLTGTLATALAVVVDGNKAAVSAIVGQYVIIKNSTITGVADGLYKAAKAIPANTTLDGTYFSSTVNGGLNDFMRSTGIGVYGIATHAVSDANSAVPTGVYSTNSSTANLPSDLASGTDREGMIFTVARGDFIYQQLYCINQKRTFFRYHAWSNWTPWASGDMTYYNADTAYSVESNRTAAIAAVFDMLGGADGILMKTVVPVTIRYTGGNFFQYLFWGRWSSASPPMVIEISRALKTIIFWSYVNGTVTKTFTVQGT